MIGNKNNRDIYINLIKYSIPKNIKSYLYVEPFGGEFGLYEIIKPDRAIYNDIDIELYNKMKVKYINRNIRFFNKDFKEIFHLFDNEKTFFYCDPPYKDKHFYKYNFNDQQHIELNSMLKKIKGKFLLSYQRNDFIYNLYKDFKINKYSGKDWMHKPEITIRNY